MSPTVKRALALALVVAMLAPLAAAQVSPPPGTPDAPSPDPPVDEPEQVECTEPVDQCFPDLIPSNPRVDGRDERYPYVACTDFINIGTAPTATAFRVLLAIDGVALGERQFTKVYQRGEGEPNICFNDLKLTAGRHTVTATVDANNDVIEEDERNNVRTVPFNVKPTPRIDLRLTSFDVLPPEGAPKTNQIFAVNVTNVGGLASAPTTLELTDDNGPMATFAVPALNPGQSRVYAHATRPEFRPVGTFVARAVVDPLGNNTEVNEDNNQAFVEYIVLEHPAPDLAITNVTVTGNMTQFRGVHAIVRVTNVGDQVVRNNLVYAINETNATIAQGYTVGMLYPNLTTVVELTLVLRAGERSIRIVTDPNGAVNERSELNNEYLLNLTIVEPPVFIDAPNLVVERLYAMPGDPRPGEVVSVGALVHNIGTNKSKETTLNFTANGKLIGSTKVPVLAADSSYSGYVPWIPAAGTYTLVAVADSTKSILEIDEDDNNLSREFLVANLTPDPEEPKPTTPTITPSPTPPTVTTPKPTTPTTSTREPVLNSKIVFGELVVSTRAAPGMARGIISASLRNPSITPITAIITVTFKVDGEVLKEVLVSGLRGAATTAATTGDVEIPAGKHTLTAEVRIVGATDAPISREKEYEQVAGPKEGLLGMPGPSPLLVAVVLVGLAVALRRRD